MAKKESKSTAVTKEYVIPLRKGFSKMAQHKKTPRAVREVAKYLLKHTKVKEVRLGMHLNEHIWKHGIKNPPAKVKVQVSIADGVAKAELFGFKYKESVKAAEKSKEPQNLKEKIEKKLGATPKKSGEPQEDALKEAPKQPTAKPEQKPDEGKAQKE